VLNLLSNAVKFSPDGGEVAVTARQSDTGELEIAIRDTGCGITAGQIDLAMQPFRQVDGMIARKHEGTGLGLPLACRLMRLHGGTIGLDSTPDTGTVARAIFPAARTILRRSAA
jgi:signal transduction histidine kinase